MIGIYCDSTSSEEAVSSKYKQIKWQDIIILELDMLVDRTKMCNLNAMQALSAIYSACEKNIDDINLS